MARQGLLPLLFLLGRPFSPLYGGLMRLRAALYRRALLPSTKLGVPVLCVGNLTLGGSGKTPVVLEICRLMRQWGLRPAVVSRGYGGQAGAAVNVVSDGSHLLLDARQAGDEPRLLAENLPGVPVLTARRRAHGALAAVQRFGADRVVLDDGFQHLALQRDLDLVLFNGNLVDSGRYLETNRVLPGGIFREPASALLRAGAFMLTNAESGNRVALDAFSAELRHRYPGRPLFRSSLEPRHLLRRVADGLLDRQPLDAFGDEPVFGFCGIGHPHSFQQTLLATGFKLGGFQAFRDHHPYSADDLAELSRRAAAAGCRLLLTTEKDLVKLPAQPENSMPLWALGMEAVLPPDFAEFLRTHPVLGPGSAG